MELSGPVKGVTARAIIGGGEAGTAIAETTVLGRVGARDKHPNLPLLPPPVGASHWPKPARSQGPREPSDEEVEGQMPSG